MIRIYTSVVTVVFLVCCWGCLKKETSNVSDRKNWREIKGDGSGMVNDRSPISPTDVIFLKKVKEKWRLHASTFEAPEVDLLKNARLEVSVQNIVSGWINPGAFNDELARLFALKTPNSIDGYAYTSPGIVFVKVKPQLVMIYEDTESGVKHEIWVDDKKADESSHQE